MSEKAPSYPPEIMCFERNLDQTAGFLARLRRRLLSVGPRPSWTRNKNGTPRLRSYLDFARIEEISTSCALVLAAEYERIGKIIGSPPPVVNLDEWNEPVFFRLWQLGFFPLLGLTESNLADQVTEDENSMTLRFFSGANAEETEQADRMLQRLAKFIDPENSLPDDIAIPLNSALSEAMVNVGMHAYPENYPFPFRHIGRWWLSGSANRKSRTLTVAIYDQGATIPVTYRELATAAKVRAFLAENWPLKDNHVFAADAVHIEAAMKYGNTQSQKPNRGKGLPQMQEAIDVCGNDRLMILSRGGRYIYHSAKKTERSTFHSSIGGTLIEWTVTLPSHLPRPLQ
ncbi:hypothetical protein EET67_23905 [Pseudaminobacter arsenicus]|uniref:ATP-binding protein n=1 Tax=Borborobacter arsenicus TaxID=1851146 RepID=A0A432UZE9_9HYPH|nr:hypothetical protein [Pseudaminobacter arsenicus]RUM95324.1 hypothetical protein EET67_23905 [Pseudaminobacter arsenicus]